MTTSDTGKALASLLQTLEGRAPACETPACPDPALIDPAEPLLAELLRSFLLWEAGTEAAQAGLKRIARRVVDFNELRVCLPDEIVSMLGADYPRAQERALRMRAALTELFVREHAVTLQPIAAMSKRDAKAYLDSLEGVPPYVSARVSLLCLGVHAAPVDGRILHRLAEAGVVGADATEASAAAVLERKIRAGEMQRSYALLQWWADQLEEIPAAEAATDDGAAKGAAASDGASSGGRKRSSKGSAGGVTARAARTPRPRSSRTPRKKK